MSDSDSLTIIIELDDHDPGRPLAPRSGRSARVGITLPTWDGSDGPSLDGPGWQDAVGSLVQQCGACIAVLVPERDHTDRLAELANRVGVLHRHVDAELLAIDNTADGAHQRLDEIGAPDIDTIRQRAKEDAARALESEKLARENEEPDRREQAHRSAETFEHLYGPERWHRATSAAFVDMDVFRHIVTTHPGDGAVLIVHEPSGNLAWLTAAQAQARVDAGILEPEPADG